MDFNGDKFKVGDVVYLAGVSKTIESTYVVDELEIKIYKGGHDVVYFVDGYRIYEDSISTSFDDVNFDYVFNAGDTVFYDDMLCRVIDIYTNGRYRIYMLLDDRYIYKTVNQDELCSCVHTDVSQGDIFSYDDDYVIISDTINNFRALGEYEFKNQKFANYRKVGNVDLTCKEN